MSPNKPALAQLLYGNTWAMDLGHLNGLVAAVEDFSPSAGRAPTPATRQTVAARGATGNIAVLSLSGVLMPRPNAMLEYFGGTSTLQFSAQVLDAAADPNIGQIVIDVNSPGGSTTGLTECASVIRQAGVSKPVVAVANGLCASAAYWLASCCSEPYITPSGEIGSIGVWQAHQDISKALDDSGIKMTLVSAGKFKTEGSPYAPLDPEARAFMQQRIDEIYRSFVATVARGRGVPIEKVRTGMGQGRCVGATQALAEQMVDGIQPFPSVLANMQDRNPATQRTASMQLPPILARLKREIDITDAGCTTTHTARPVATTTLARLKREIERAEAKR
jgi:signal peptide peptidase SppA